MHKLQFGAALLLLSFAPVPFPKPEGGKADLLKMQGEWNTDAYKVVIEKAAEWRRAEDGDATVIVKGNRMTFYHKGNRTSTWVIRLDATKYPRQIDCEEASGNYRCLGIYRWKGMALIISEFLVPNIRPTTFDLPMI